MITHPVLAYVPSSLGCGATGLSKGTIAWASQHDWYLATTLCGMGVIVRDYNSELIRGVWHDEPTEITFFDRSELRAWAGY